MLRYIYCWFKNCSGPRPYLELASLATYTYASFFKVTFFHSQMEVTKKDPQKGHSEEPGVDIDAKKLN